MARILIVDDSFVARKALRKMVTDLGHTVVSEVADGTHAFTEYASYRPDIVTMDLKMEGISGAEATSKICAAFPEAKIIVISATEDRPIILDALERGARHYMIKPVTPEKAAATIDNVLNQKFDLQRYKDLVSKLKDSADFSCEAQFQLQKQELGKVARVLIVDDSSVARKSLREIVTSLGHVVVGEAENGAQAFVEYAQHKPDIVTMDLTMQGMNGAEATSKIIATFPEAKIIVISAMEERRVILDALERGARHFIIKPITKENVSCVLTNVLQQKFDLQKHKMVVQKLRNADNSPSALPEVRGFLPPYTISLDNKLIWVQINSNITMTSFQSLVIELEEYLTGAPRILFDFGDSPGLAETVLIEFDQLIMKIENGNGTVKAVSRNQAFADSCIQAGKSPYLAATIRCLAN